MDRSGEMEMFVTVVREGGFSAAARKLELTPSAVSKQIARLEDRLGVTLLNRSTRRLSLTEVGRAFHERCCDILSQIAEMESSVAEHREAPRGRLRVSMSPGIARHQVVPALPRFYQRYPEVVVECHLSEAFVDIVKDAMDIALRIGELDDSSLIARRLAAHRRVVCAAPSYLALHGAPETPDQLAGHNCLTLSLNPGLNRWKFRVPASTPGQPEAGSGRKSDSVVEIQVAGSFEANSVECLQDAALAGLGIARLSTLVAGPSLDAGRLVPLLGDYAVPEHSSMYAVYPAGRHLSRKVRVFVDFLAEHFSQST